MSAHRLSWLAVADPGLSVAPATHIMLAERRAAIIKV